MSFQVNDLDIACRLFDIVANRNDAAVLDKHATDNRATRVQRMNSTVDEHQISVTLTLCQRSPE